MKNEVIKLLKKKSFYIVTLIFVFFCILTNVVYKVLDDFTREEEVDIQEIESENEELDLTVNEDLLIYVENLTTLKMEELKSEYSSNNQKYLIEQYLYSTIYHLYESTYILKDLELAQEYELELDQDLHYVALDNYEYFLNERIEYLESRVSATTGIEQERYKKLLDLAIYRLEEQVPYNSENYLHNSLLFLEENTVEYVNLLHDDDLTSEEEARMDYLNEQMTLHEYVIEHQEDIFNTSDLRAVLINFSGEFGLFILIYVIMIAGSIVSEEYTRGTVKSMFTKPYKRRTILTSKLLVVILFVPVIMLFMSLIEILIGGIILGFDSLSVPVVLYIHDTLITYPVLDYLASLLLSGIAMYLVIGIVAFMISTITLSTSAAITISFLFYLLANVISNLALAYDLPIFKCFVSLYWDFSYLVNHVAQPFDASILTSILVIAIYLVIMLCLTYVTFIKKDVKNV